MGPRIDLCGTPEVTGKGLDVAPNEVTRWDRSCRYDSSHVRKSPPPPLPPKKNTHVASLRVLRGLLCQKI